MATTLGRTGLVCVCVFGLVGVANAQDVEQAVQELSTRTDKQASEIASLKAEKSGSWVTEILALANEELGQASRGPLEAAGSLLVKHFGATQRWHSQAEVRMDGFDDAITRMNKKLDQLEARAYAGSLGFYLQSDGSYRLIEVFTGNGPTFLRDNVEAGAVDLGGHEDVLTAVADLVAGRSKEECWDVFTHTDYAKPLTTRDGQPIVLCAYDPALTDVVGQPGEITVSPYGVLALSLGGDFIGGGTMTVKVPKIDLNP